MVAKLKLKGFSKLAPDGHMPARPPLKIINPLKIIFKGEEFCKGYKPTRSIFLVLCHYFF